MGVGTDTVEGDQTVEGRTGKPDLPSTNMREPQRAVGDGRNAPPKTFCFESYMSNTGEPERDVKEDGE